VTTDRPRSSLVVWLIVAAILFPAGYVLSTGPAVWLHDHGYLSGWPPAIYAPLVYLCGQSDQMATLFLWYFSFWHN
jgi:hypothetical protein